MEARRSLATGEKRRGEEGRQRRVDGKQSGDDSRREEGRGEGGPGKRARERGWEVQTVPSLLSSPAAC